MTVTSEQRAVSGKSRRKSMIRRIFLCLLMTVVLLTVYLAEAQQTNVPRIGMLVNGTPSSHKFIIDEFQQGLRDLGYVEGKNLLLEVRYAEGKLDRLPELARGARGTEGEVIFTNATPGTVAVKRATSTIPIVFTGVGDPVEAGLVKSFAKPGGNLTGISILSPDLGGKRLELLKEAVPGITQIAVLWSPSASTTAALKATQAAADALRLQLQSLEVRSPDDFTGVSQTIVKRRVRALLTNPSPVLNTIRTRVVEFATKNRLPAMYANLQFIEAGGLMAYAHSSADVGVLRDAEATAFKDYEIAARALKIKLQSLDVRSSKLDFEEAFQIAVKQRVNALVVVSGALSLSHRKLIADLAIKNRLPSMHERGEEVEAGGLMSYSADNYESFKRAAVYVDKILKGTKPADLPVEQPTKFEFMINLKTAKQIGVTIPQSVLFRADRVIR